MPTTLKGKDILHVKDLKLEQASIILETAARYENVLSFGGRLNNMAGKTMATLFFEPSTQTRLTFETAMLMMGGHVVSVTDTLTSTSTVKGERLYDTGKMISGYTNVAVVRLGKYGPRFYFVSAPELKMPAEITRDLLNDGIEVIETTNMEEAAAKSDVLYMTRVQKERFSDEAAYERLKDVYVINQAFLENAKHGITIMHPLPRTGELDREVDDYEGSAYFRQAANGLPIRMAVIALITGND